MIWVLLACSLIPAVVVGLFGYYWGYHQARNRYERANLAIFTPEELQALMRLAEDRERKREIRTLNRQWRSS